MPIFVENRELVTPGTLLAKGDYKAGEHAYKRGDCIYSTHTGLVERSDNVIGVIALVGCYVPKVGDLVIGKVVDSHFTYWEIDINSPYIAKLKVGDVRRGPGPARSAPSKFLPTGTLVAGKIVEFDRTKDPVVTIRGRGLGRIQDGHLVKINPAKVPRLIGRGGSMIKMLVEKTGCEIKVGQNGLIVVKGKSPREERVAISAIRRIETEAHTSGLTDRISAMIDRELQNES
ncbi:TPA: RNA-binding protein [Candidatus Bathyarchaeota archaeon]|nr:RNA-binding protein [Candidatus Bathyarchaeota archaeon]